MVVGFDMHTRLSAPNNVPVMAKVYFHACFSAAEKGITRWDAVRMGIRQINSLASILRLLETIEDYLSTKPKEFENSVRYFGHRLSYPREDPPQDLCALPRTVI